MAQRWQSAESMAKVFSVAAYGAVLQQQALDMRERMQRERNVDGRVSGEIVRRHVQHLQLPACSVSMAQKRKRMETRLRELSPLAKAFAPEQTIWQLRSERLRSDGQRGKRSAKWLQAVSPGMNNETKLRFKEQTRTHFVVAKGQNLKLQRRGARKGLEQGFKACVAYIIMAKLQNFEAIDAWHRRYCVRQLRRAHVAKAAAQPLDANAGNFIGLARRIIHVCIMPLVLKLLQM